MIITVSNRNVAVDAHSRDPVIGDHTIFGDRENQEGGWDELRVATAELRGDDWRVTLYPDTPGPDFSTRTEELFAGTLARIRNGDLPGNWVVFIHGFNQSFVKNLKKCKEIEDYGVNVLAFSWPSNPGPNGGFFSAAGNKIKEYQRARANANHSLVAADRFMEKIVRYVRGGVDESCGQSLTLLVHSLGNYLFQRTVEDSLFTDDLGIFDNILLHQADADNDDHDRWVDRLGDAKRIYVTINERDSVLQVSSLVNGRRLGNTPHNLMATLPTYVDFSFGDWVFNEHRLFRPEMRRNNPVIGQFFARALNGRPAETISSLTFNGANGAYQLSDRPGEQEEWETP